MITTENNYRPSITRKFMILRQMLMHLYDASFAYSDITGTQASVLYYIYLCNRNCKTEIYQRDIQKEFDIRRSSVTSILQELEQDGYLIREKVPSDSRLKKLTLTGKTLEKIGGIQQRIGQINRTTIDGFKPEEIDQLNQLLKKIHQNLDTALRSNNNI